MEIKKEHSIPRRKQDQKTFRNLGEPSKDILVFPKKGKVSIFRNKNYKVSVSIVVIPSLMRQIDCVFGNGARLKFIKDNVLE